MARVNKKQPGPDASMLDRLKYITDELGLDEYESVTIDSLPGILSEIKSVNANYVLTGTGEPFLASARTVKVDDYSGIIERFRLLRLSKNMTQAEFGKVLGKARPTIASIEQGHQAPTISDLRILRIRFGVSYSYLIDGNGSSLDSDNETIKKQLDECKADKAALLKLIQER